MLDVQYNDGPMYVNDVALHDYIIVIQFTNQCFCGDAYGSHGEDYDEESCDMDCAGDAGQNCGGPWRNAVYVVGRTFQYMYEL